MTTETTNQQQLIEESQAIWDEKAAWWDAFMGDDGSLPAIWQAKG